MEKNHSDRILDLSNWKRCLSLAFLVALAAVVPHVVSAHSPPSGIRPYVFSSPDPTCERYFGKACLSVDPSWLPGFDNAPDYWRLGEAKRIYRRDRFLYETRNISGPRRFGTRGPNDGTFFVYGDAGPTKGYVVYDPVHRIAFYEQGCCSWEDTIAAADTPAPPKPVVIRNLQHLSTVRGIRLGQTVREVERIYGAAKLLPLRGRPQIRVLAYTTWPPYIHAGHYPAGWRDPCGQFENFYFRQGRLVLIQLGNGC